MVSPSASDDAGGQNALGTDPKVDVAQQNWQRYEYVRGRGHSCYCEKARRNENYYLGDGLQWDEDVRAELEAQGRPAVEINEILGAVNAACGYQIANRMDVTCAPRGQGADDVTAKALNLTFKSELDRVKFRWIESQVFQDGQIEQRGYFDLRISTNANMQGEIALCALDPMDVIPDPDAKSYDPDDWTDVIVTRWLTADEIEMFWGRAARLAIEAYNPEGEQDFGDGETDGTERSRFGDNRTASTYDAQFLDAGIRRYRVIDRQHHRYDWSTVAIYPTGDVIKIEDVDSLDLPKLETQNVLITKRRTKRVRWTVTCCNTVLSDDWSPYRHFTVIPYFPIFRRGRTRGMVDNAISPQDVINKGTSQSLHIINSTANSGWSVEEGSLTNMDTEDLEDQGSSTGLVVEYKKGSNKPEKITANQIPTGLVQLIETAKANFKAVTGVNESMLGIGDQDMSGVAIQSRQFAAQQQLAMPLDNLARTRHMLAMRVLEMFQDYYTDEREFRITEMDQVGELRQQRIVINHPQPDGSILHDFTLGKYDIVISDQPMQITFDNSQFEQIKAMRKDMGVRIPDPLVVRYSNLADKGEVIRAIEEQPAQTDPLAEAKAGTEQAKQEQLRASAAQSAAQTELLKAEAVNSNVTAMYSATRAAAEVAAMPQIASVSDELLRSAGFVDADAPPIVPTVPESARIPAPPPSESTNPLTPPHPDVGVDAGIERPNLPNTGAQ